MRTRGRVCPPGHEAVGCAQGMEGTARAATVRLARGGPPGSPAAGGRLPPVPVARQAAPAVNDCSAKEEGPGIHARRSGRAQARRVIAAFRSRSFFWKHLSSTTLHTSEPTCVPLAHSKTARRGTVARAARSSPVQPLFRTGLLVDRHRRGPCRHRAARLPRRSPGPARRSRRRPNGAGTLMPRLGRMRDIDPFRSRPTRVSGDSKKLEATGQGNPAIRIDVEFPSGDRQTLKQPRSSCPHPNGGQNSRRASPERRAIQPGSSTPAERFLPTTTTIERLCADALVDALERYFADGLARAPGEPSRFAVSEAGPC